MEDQIILNEGGAELTSDMTIKKVIDDLESNEWVMNEEDQRKLNQFVTLL